MAFNERYGSSVIEDFGNKTERKEVAHEQVDKTGKDIEYSLKLTQSHYEIQKAEQAIYIAKYTDNLDDLWSGLMSPKEFSDSLDLSLNEKLKTTEVPKSKEKVTKPIEVQKPNLELNNKRETLIRNANLSDLAYSKFRTIQIEENGRNINKTIVTDVRLDRLSYPNLAKLFDNEVPSNLNADERFLFDYIKTAKAGDINRNLDPNFKEEVKEIFAVTGLDQKFGKVLMAKDYTRDKLNNNVVTDIPSESLPDPLEQQALLYSGFDVLRKQKIIDNQRVLDSLNKNQEKVHIEGLKEGVDRFEVKDYFPRPGEDGDSSFGGVCSYDHKEKIKTFAIRGTRVSSWGDLMADGKLVLKRVPFPQVLDMLKFVKRNINEGEKFNITGHSLGGALSQILTAMYTDKDFNTTDKKEHTRVNETTTFNSPGAKGLTVSGDKNDQTSEIIAKFDNYEYNCKNNPNVGEKIVAVKGVKGPSLISNLNEHIGNNEIRLQNLDSHKITELIKYLEKLEKMSELDKIRIREIENKDKDKRTNN